MGGGRVGEPGSGREGAPALVRERQGCERQAVHGLRRPDVLAADPVPLTGIVKSFFVWKVYLKSALMSSMSSRK